MAFLKNLGEKIGSAAGSAADKAKKMAETSKLNSAISAEERQINQAYLEIGKQIFEQDRDKLESPVAEQCNKILASQHTIEELKLKIADINKTEEKPVVVESVEVHPPVVEVVVEAPQPQAEAPARKFCSNCGAENNVNSKFCNGCGQPMNQQ